MTERYQQPRMLEAARAVDGFECHSDEQARWLRENAKQSVAAGTSKVLVVTQPNSPDVVAYYAWCMACITLADAPPWLRRGAERYLQPVALLARLDVAVAHEGRGFGAGLLAYVISARRRSAPRSVAAAFSSTPRQQPPVTSIST